MDTTMSWWKKWEWKIGLVNTEEDVNRPIWRHYRWTNFATLPRELASMQLAPLDHLLAQMSCFWSTLVMHFAFHLWLFSPFLLALVMLALSLACVVACSLVPTHEKVRKRMAHLYNDQRCNEIKVLTITKKEMSFQIWMTIMVMNGFKF